MKTIIDQNTGEVIEVETSNEIAERKLTDAGAITEQTRDFSNVPKWKQAMSTSQSCHALSQRSYLWEEGCRRVTGERRSLPGTGPHMCTVHSEESRDKNNGVT